MAYAIQNIIAAAEAGGEVLKHYFGTPLELIQKTTPADFYTRADIEAEQAIIKVLEQHFPAYNIFSEERGRIDKNSEYTFVIDPLDGSNNFVIGLPNFSSAIALMKSGVTVAAAVHNPMARQTYHAMLGQGAWQGPRRLTVNHVEDMEQATIVYVPSYATPRRDITNLFHILEEKLEIKRVGLNWSPTFDFCLLAAGTIEGILNYGSEPYDYLAGKLIAKEAGALVTDLHGKPEHSDENSFFLASNSTKLHQALLDVAPKA